MRILCASLLRYSIEILLLSAMILTAMGSHLASAADGRGGGACTELLAKTDSIPDTSAGLPEKLEDLKLLWLSLSLLSDSSQRHKKEEFDRWLGGILRAFPETRPQIRNFLGEIYSRRAPDMKSTPVNLQRLRAELTELKTLYSQLEAEGRDLAEYMIVGDSRLDPNVKVEVNNDDPNGFLVVKLDRYVEMPAGNGQVSLVDLRKEGGHTSIVWGVRLLPDGSILSWSRDHTLIVWEKRGSEYVPIHRLGDPGNQDDRIPGHLNTVVGARLLRHGSILSWSTDHTLIVWEKRGSKYRQIHRLGKPRNNFYANFGHLSPVDIGRLLPDGTVASIDMSGRVLLWRPLDLPQTIANKLAEMENDIKNLEIRLSAAGASP